MTVLRERGRTVLPRPRSLPPLCAAVKQWVSFRLPHVLSKTNSCLPSLHLKLSFSKPRGSDDGSRKFSALCGHQTQTRPRLPAQPGISDPGGCPKPTPRPRPNFLGCVTGGKARPRAHPARPLTAGLRRLSEPGAGSGRARGGPGPRGSVLPGPRESPTGRRHGLRRDHLQDRVAAAQPRLLGGGGWPQLRRGLCHEHLQELRQLRAGQARPAASRDHPLRRCGDVHHRAARLLRHLPGVSGWPGAVLGHYPHHLHRRSVRFCPGICLQGKGKN